LGLEEKMSRPASGRKAISLLRKDDRLDIYWEKNDLPLGSMSRYKIWRKNLQTNRLPKGPARQGCRPKGGGPPQHLGGERIVTDLGATIRTEEGACGTQKGLASTSQRKRKKKKNHLSTKRLEVQVDILRRGDGPARQARG